MSQEIIDRVTHFAEGFDARVQATPADAWGNTAPCEGWVAVDVVEHVCGSAESMAAALGGDAPAEFDRNDPVGSWKAASSKLLAVLPTADLNTPVERFGGMPAAMVIGRFMSMDLLVHTWDLARAVGGDEQLDETDVAHAFEGVKGMEAMLRRPGVFGPAVPAAEGDDLQTQFLKFLGRQV